VTAAVVFPAAALDRKNLNARMRFQYDILEASPRLATN
jgi:hypothetical protein